MSGSHAETCAQSLSDCTKDCCVCTCGGEDGDYQCDCATCMAIASDRMSRRHAVAESPDTVAAQGIQRYGARGPLSNPPGLGEYVVVTYNDHAAEKAAVCDLMLGVIRFERERCEQAGTAERTRIRDGVTAYYDSVIAVVGGYSFDEAIRAVLAIIDEDTR